MVNDRIESVFSGYLAFTLRGGKRELVRLDRIGNVRSRREGGSAIELTTGAVLLTSIPTEKVLAAMRRASAQIGGSHAATS